MKSFKLISQEFIKDYNLQGSFFKHKSGANICFLKNNDENRFFSASFKTLPENNKGIPHILEHIILNGSENYNLEDTFGYLLKSSLWSYLNALTFQDKTIYPVGSFLKFEFEKLFKIYIDSVFKPTLKIESFFQEGIHNIIKDNKIFDIESIVYNEMLSEYSDVYTIIKNENYFRLFENSSYKYNSAGYPTDILKASYKEVIDYYKKYYIPENSFLFFYGNINIEYYLNFINENYLKDFEKTEKFLNTEPEIITSKKYCKYTFYNKKENKRYLASTFLISEYTDVITLYLFEILIEYLFKYSDLTSILKKYGFENVLHYNFDKEIKYTALTLVIENENKSILDFENTILSSLKTIIKKGLNKEKLLFLINQLEFKLKEEDFGYKPKGFGYNLLMINNWMNNKNPYLPFEREGNITCLKENVNKNKFESLVEKYLIKNKKVIWSEVISSRNYNLSFDSKKKEIIKQNEFEIFPEKSYMFSEQENIPTINIKDIKIKKDIYYEKNICGNKTIFYESEIENTFIVKLLFKVDNLTDLELNHLGILKLMLQKSLLDNYNFAGEIIFSFRGLGLNGFFEVTIKGIISCVENIFLVIKNILFNFKLEEIEYKTEIEKIKKDLQINTEKYLINRLKSKCNVGFKNRENVLGIEFIKFLEKENIQNDYVVNVFNKIFLKDNLEVFITGGNYEVVKKYLEEIIFDLPTKKKTNIKKTVLLNKRVKENISINSNTSSVGMLIELENNLLFTEIIILKSILENDFLLKYIRNEGSAYGYGVEIFGNNIILYSFKDGNCLKTIEVFEKLDAYLNNINFTDKELEMFFISGVNEYIKPKHINKQFDIFVNDFYENSINKIIIDEKLIKENFIKNIKFKDERKIIYFE